MPFKKGNQEAVKKTGIKQASHIQDYLRYLSGGAARAYYENLERQFNGEELSKPVKEGMDRFEKNTEFVTPKLARQEVTGKDGKDLQPVLVKFINADN